MERVNFSHHVAQWSIVTDATLQWLRGTTLRNIVRVVVGSGMKMAPVYELQGKTSFTTNPLSRAAPHDKIHARIIKRDDGLFKQSRTWGGVLTNLFHITGTHLIEHIFSLPGIEILCPGLQNVWETDSEVSQSYDGVCSDHRKSGALEHCEHETDVFLTRRWADRKEARNYNFKM